MQHCYYFMRIRKQRKWICKAIFSGAEETWQNIARSDNFPRPIYERDLSAGCVNMQEKGSHWHPQTLSWASLRTSLSRVRLLKNEQNEWNMCSAPVCKINSRKGVFITVNRRMRRRFAVIKMQNATNAMSSGAQLGWMSGKIKSPGDRVTKI